MPERTNLLMSEEASVNIGALQQRVFGLEGGQRQLVDGLSTLTNRVENLFAGLSAKIEERSRPQYTLLISLGVFGLAVIVAVGGLAYAPIRENQSDLKAALLEMTKAQSGLGERFVSIRELEGRSVRTREEMARLNSDLNSQEIGQRRELEQSVANLQRQIDDVKRFNQGLVSAPDFLKNLDERMRTLELQRRAPQ